MSCPSHILANLWGCSINGNPRASAQFLYCDMSRKTNQPKPNKEWSFKIVQSLTLTSKGEQMPGWQRCQKILIKKINNTERHKRRKSHTPSLPDYCMLKWHANTIEQSASIHWLNRDKVVPTGVFRCLECSLMQILYREREETVWKGLEQKTQTHKTQTAFT